MADIETLGRFDTKTISFEVARGKILRRSNGLGRKRALIEAKTEVIQVAAGLWDEEAVARPAPPPAVSSDREFAGQAAG